MNDTTSTTAAAAAATPAHTPDMTNEQAQSLASRAASMPDIAGADAVTSTPLHEIKAYTDGTVASGPAPLPNRSPDGAEAILRAGGEVTGLGYVLNLADIDNIADLVLIAFPAEKTPYWPGITGEDRHAAIAADIEAHLDGTRHLPADDVLTAFVNTATLNIKAACDNLINDYLRAPLTCDGNNCQSAKKHGVTWHEHDDTPPAGGGVRSLEQARALPLVSIEDIATVYRDGDPGDIQAFKDADGTTRRVVVMPDFSLAKA